MHVLIISISSQRNIILTTPLLHAIKQKFPESEIHFVTSFKHKNFVEKIPQISHTYFISGDKIPVIFSLLKINFACVLDLEESNAGFIFKKYLRDKYANNAEFVSYPKSVVTQLLARKAAYKSQNLSTKFLQASTILNLPIQNLQLHYAVTDADNLHKDDIPTSHQLGFVCLNLEQIALSQQILIDFCTQLKYPIILLGTKDNYAFAETLKAIDIFKIYNACGKYTQVETFQILKQAKCFISAENILVYVAAAAQKPLVIVCAKKPLLQDIIPYADYNRQNFNYISGNLTINDVSQWF